MAAILSFFLSKYSFNVSILLNCLACILAKSGTFRGLGIPVAKRSLALVIDPGVLTKSAFKVTFLAVVLVFVAVLLRDGLLLKGVVLAADLVSDGLLLRGVAFTADLSNGEVVGLDATLLMLLSGLAKGESTFPDLGVGATKGELMADAV